MRVILVALLTVTASNSGGVEQPNKPAWQWTDSERIAALTDDAAAAARLAAARRNGSVGDRAGHPEPHDHVDGTVNPHLFMPWELFDNMAALAFAEDAHTRAVYRATKDAERQRLGLPEDMWDRLEQISEPYLNERRREREIGLSTLPAAERKALLSAFGPGLCRTRHAALTTAGAEFGPAFTTFLYTAIARTASKLSLQKPNAEMLERISGGCR